MVQMNIGSKNAFKSAYSIKKKKKVDNLTLKNLNLKPFFKIFLVISFETTEKYYEERIQKEIWLI